MQMAYTFMWMNWIRLQICCCSQARMIMPNLLGCFEQYPSVVTACSPERKWLVPRGHARLSLSQRDRASWLAGLNRNSSRGETEIVLSCVRTISGYIFLSLDCLSCHHNMNSSGWSGAGNCNQDMSYFRLFFCLESERNYKIWTLPAKFENSIFQILFANH